MVPCLEPVNNPTLYLRSILNVYEVFEPLHMLWMGIWVHPYTVAPVQVGAIFQFWKIGAKGEPKYHHAVSCLEAVNHPTLLLIHPYCMFKSIRAPSYAVDGHVGAPLHPLEAIFSNPLCISDPY